MNEQEKALEQAALEFARANKKKIAKEITDRQRYLSESSPVSVFMAGSPGAGKTEFSKRYLSLLQENSGYEILRIDPDDYRSRIPGYTGSNSWLVQGAATTHRGSRLPMSGFRLSAVSG